MRIEDEGGLDSLHANEVEFVLYALSYCILYIVEAKVSDINKQGRGQLWLELHGKSLVVCNYINLLASAASFMNRMSQFGPIHLEYLYGAVSTAEIWKFYRFCSPYHINC
jgi:hypothetical protein